MDVFIRAMGNHVRMMRKAKGLSQQQLGKKAGFDYRYIGFIEQARGNPTVKTLGKVAEALDVMICDLCPSREDYDRTKKNVPVKLSEREKVLAKTMKHLNKVNIEKLKTIQKIVRVSINGSNGK